MRRHSPEEAERQLVDHFRYLLAQKRRFHWPVYIGVVVTLMLMIQIAKMALLELRL